MAMAEVAVIRGSQSQGQILDEEALVTAAIRNPQAFDKLYDQNYALVANCVYRRVGNVHDTEDLVSEVFCRVLKSLPGYRWRRIPFRVWIYRVATNVVNDWVKARKRRNTLTLPSLDEFPDKEQFSLSNEYKTKIQQAVMALTPKHQEVVSLYYFEDLTVEEVAMVVGCRVGTIKSRLSRARAALEAVLPNPFEV